MAGASRHTSSSSLPSMTTPRRARRATTVVALGSAGLPAGAVGLPYAWTTTMTASMGTAAGILDLWGYRALRRVEGGKGCRNARAPGEQPAGGLLRPSCAGLVLLRHQARLVRYVALEHEVARLEPGATQRQAQQLAQVLDEIGRASCRERGESQGVAEASKG